MTPFFWRAHPWWKPSTPGNRPRTYKVPVEPEGAFILNDALSVERYEVTRVVQRDVLQVIDWGALGSAYFAPKFWLIPMSMKNADYKEYCGIPYPEYVTPGLVMHETAHVASSWMQTAADLTCGTPIWWMTIGDQHCLTRWCASLRSHEREWAQSELLRAVLFDVLEDYYLQCVRSWKWEGYVLCEILFYTVARDVLSEALEHDAWDRISQFDTGTWRLRIYPVRPSIRYMPYIQVKDAINERAARSQLGMCARDLVPKVCFTFSLL